MIMPLATRRDKVTQVRWGLEDFRRRFGREAGRHVAARDRRRRRTLEVLAEAGVQFTILAPTRPRRMRPLDAEAWEEVGERIDPSRPYLWRGPAG